MNNTVTTNEWIDAERCKPWKDRPVLVRTETGLLFVAIWKGLYWVDANTGMRHTQGGLNPTHKITYFYIFEKFNENDIL